MNQDIKYINNIKINIKERNFWTTQVRQTVRRSHSVVIETEPRATTGMHQAKKIERNYWNFPHYR